MNPRGIAIVRIWDMITLLRRRSYSLPELARRFAPIHERTIRRDLELIQLIGVPVVRLPRDGEADTVRWRIYPTPEWPSGETWPSQKLSKSTRPLPGETLAEARRRLEQESA